MKVKPATPIDALCLMVSLLKFDRSINFSSCFCDWMEIQAQNKTQKDQSISWQRQNRYKSLRTCGSVPWMGHCYKCDMERECLIRLGRDISSVPPARTLVQSPPLWRKRLSLPEKWLTIYWEGLRPGKMLTEPWLRVLAAIITKHISCRSKFDPRTSPCQSSISVSNAVINGMTSKELSAKCLILYLVGFRLLGTIWKDTNG